MLAAPSSSSFYTTQPRDLERTAGSMPVWRGDDSFKLSTESKAYALNMQGETQPNAQAKPDESFGFGDIVDMLNPLQNLPIVGNIYRSITGDTIKPASQVIGGTLFGGMLGFGLGMVNVIAQNETGKDAPEAVMGFLSGGDSGDGDSAAANPQIAIASRKPRYNV